jgi:hypothetical protein
MTNTRGLPSLDNHNSWADFWRYDIGVNVIPADTRNKVTHIKWSTWQDNPISEDQHNRWKSQNSFSNGLAIISGIVWHNNENKGLYFTFIDVDNKKAITEICTRNGKTISLQEMSQKFLVEQHRDSPYKAHIYFYSPIPFVKKSADEVIGLEVKGLGEHGIAYCSPSIHKHGQPYEIIGTTTPITVTADQAKELMRHIDSICKKYGIEYLDKHYGNLLDSDAKIHQGDSHNSLISIANSILFRSGNDIKESKEKHDNLKSTFININTGRCLPPLPADEVNTIWNDAVAYYTRIRGQEKESEKKEEEQQKQSHASILVQLATNNARSFFKDQYGTAFALVSIKSDNHNEVVRLEGEKFKRYLSRLFYDHQNGKVVGSDAINSAVQVLQARTEYGGQTIPLSLRVACKNNNDNGGSLEFCYDLTNSTWQYIRITGQKWDIADNNNDSSILFVRYNQTPQDTPDRHYEPDIFDRFLKLTNVKDDQNKLLLKVYIISLFVPDIAHPILILHGEKGSAKSTLQLLIKLLVDPAKPSLLTIHKNSNEFVQQLSHTHIAFYDNLKHAPYWLSDEVCKAVTGIGQTKRKLYTDDDDIVYEYKRCLGFSGINIILTEPDALDRSILIELNRIAREDRRVESEIIAEFRKLRPKSLGYIFDTMVKALQIKPSIKLNDLPRMADFALWGEAISQAMGYKPLEFINAYYENIGRQNIEAVETHPLGLVIAKYFEEQSGNELKALEGSPMEVQEVLDAFAQKIKVNTNHKLWPKSPNALSRRLNQIRSNLLEGLGVEVTISRLTTDRNGSKANTSYLKIGKIPPVSPIHPAEQNHEGNCQKSTGDIISPVDKIPPVENAQDHVQKSEIGGIGGTGDILLSSRDGCTTLVQKNTTVTQQKQQFKFDCYYCDIFQTNIKEEYESHVVLRHPGRPCYPSKPDLVRFELEAKGKEWEM